MNRTTLHEGQPGLVTGAPLDKAKAAMILLHGRGASPESIRDLKLRAEYERAIAQNSAKARRYNDQYWLKQTAPDFYKTVEKYLVSAYSRPPTDSAQLERLLSQYVDDNDVRVRILAEVRKVGSQQE